MSEAEGGGGGGSSSTFLCMTLYESVCACRPHLYALLVILDFDKIIDVLYLANMDMEKMDSSGDAIDCCC